ncbi:hypothetical protein BH11BAC7_BH11BAC7_13530 [soil metagenome]
MAVYRFRIVFEDDEDVVREIDILGKQTYADFHRVIQEAIGFDNSKNASFFMSDDLWKKGQEIALQPPPQDDDEDDYPAVKKKGQVLEMSKCKMASFIDDPHQRMIYVFDPAAKWTLLVELSRIVPDDAKASYPKCTKSAGIAPKQYKQVLIPPPLEEDEEDDAEDKKAKEKIFTAVEGIDEDEHLGDSEEGEDAPADSEEAEPGTEEESTEEEGGDFDPDAFGGGEQEEF